MSFLDGLSRPLKAAGVTLIGVAVVAAVIGGTTLLTGGGSEDDSAQPAPSSTAPETPPGLPGTGGTQPPTSSQAPSTTTPPPSSKPSTTTPAPGGTAGASPAPGQPGGPAGGDKGDQQASAKWVTVRVYNNSTIHGLAARAAEDFRQQGWKVAEVSNYASGIIPSTTAYYRPGTDEETAAKALAGGFGMRSEQRFQGIDQSSPGVIVIVTNDYKGASKAGS